MKSVTDKQLATCGKLKPVCEWLEIEEGSGIYNTCKEGYEFHLSEGLELWPFCHWCGGSIKVVELSDSADPSP
jgi:hypothetical protein